MELVYLWVEKYKNILKQGFILNPICEEETINFDNKIIEIILKEKKNYENPFGEHFNIITIVGKNGSGKTNLTKALSSIIRTISNKQQKRPNKNNYDITECPEKFCLIIKEEKSYIAYCSDTNLFNLEIITKNGKILLAKKEDTLKPTPFEKRELVTHKNKEINVAKFQPFLKIEDTYAPEFPQWNDIYGISRHKLKNYFYYDRFRLYDTVRNIIEFMKFETRLPQNKKIKLLEENPQLRFDLYSPYVNLYDALQWTNNRVQRINAEKYPITKIISHSFSTLSTNARKNIYMDIDMLLKSELLQKMFFGYALGEILSIVNKPSIKKIVRDSIVKELMDISNSKSFPNSRKRISFYENIMKTITQKRVKRLLQAYIDFEGDENESSELKDILRNYYTIVTSKEFGEGTIIQLNTANMSNFDIRMQKDEILKIEELKGISKNLYKKSKTDTNGVYDFLSLSTGEQRILKFMSDVYFIAKTGGYIRDKNANINTDIFIFDEMDLSWHPEWQRKMVYYIKDIFDNIIAPTSKRKINLIFTTHSPFILSDMSQSNVIVLKDENGLCKSEKCSIKTFANNIHTLFANSFFMKSTMGAFAEEKLSEVIDNVYSCNPDEKYINDFLELLDEDDIYYKILVSTIDNQRIKGNCEKNSEKF